MFLYIVPWPYALPVDGYLLQVVPVPRQALAAATLAVEPEQGADNAKSEGGNGEKRASIKLVENMVRWIGQVVFFILAFLLIEMMWKGAWRYWSQSTLRQASIYTMFVP